LHSSDWERWYPLCGTRLRVLLPAEQNAGLAIYYGVGGRWGQKARERFSCAD
jgi:hypothetical protein